MISWNDEEALRATGCRFHWRGVICYKTSQCGKCGWNPAVEKARKEKSAAASATNTDDGNDKMKFDTVIITRRERKCNDGWREGTG